MSAQTQIREEIVEALELLQKAAREEKEEVKRVILHSVNQLSELLAEKTEQVQEKVENNPWPYITVTALGAFIIGSLMKNKE